MEFEYSDHMNALRKYYRQKHTACKTTRGKGLHEENIIKTNAHCLQHN